MGPDALNLKRQDRPGPNAKTCLPRSSIFFVHSTHLTTSPEIVFLDSHYTIHHYLIKALLLLLLDRSNWIGSGMRCTRSQPNNPISPSLTQWTPKDKCYSQ